MRTHNLENLYEQFGGELFGYLQKHCGNLAAAEDAQAAALLIGLRAGSWMHQESKSAGTPHAYALQTTPKMALPFFTQSTVKRPSFWSTKRIIEHYDQP
jgi:hypothetical protein